MVLVSLERRGYDARERSDVVTCGVRAAQCWCGLQRVARGACAQGDPAN